MKKIIALLLTAVMVLSLFAGCKQEEPDPTDGSAPTGTTGAPTNPSSPSDPADPSDPTNPSDPSVPSDPSNPSVPSDPTDPSQPGTEARYITIAEAMELCENYVDAPSTERFYIRATIVSIDNPTYGQMTISDETGTIMVYGSANADGSVRYDAMEEKPDAGDEVLLYGTLQNYKGNTKEVQNGWIIEWTEGEPPVGPNDPDDPDGPGVQLPPSGTELTIEQLLALPVAEGVTTEQFYIIHATVESVTNATYGAMIITDGTGSISVYNSKAEDGTYYSEMSDKPYKGDTVVLKCNVQNYYGEYEVKQAYIVSFEHAEVEVDLNEYKEMSIAKARDAAKGTKVKVSGVVARITYANGYIPSGVILVDKTSSIYIYDGDLAARVKIGNTIEVAASKTYWILESEQNNAQKFGYAGCNQLEGATLISNDEGNSSFDKSWIETTTVKEILDTPVTNDITTKIFKVTALVKKVPGNGFTNYYINDLDGYTGSYAYSQCNGGDFAWLDEFDGKICTVYVMALNAKSTASDCYWRFLPIAVIDEGFDSSSVNFAENAVKFYGVGQFLSSYTGNPALELLKSVSNELLGYKDAKLTYTSSDSSVISIDDYVMNCHKSGTVTITVTATCGSQTYSEEVTITVTITEQSGTYPTVSDAIAAAIGDTVTVKGIVGPSLVNKTGFYLIDDTGVIAVETDAATLETLEIGYEVVLEARRGFNTKDGTTPYGQTCLKDATVVVNNYGSHEYSTASFKGEISVADFYNLDINVDYTTSVYTMKATVVLEETKYYTNILLSDGTTQVRLYCSGASQYNWLKEFAGQEVTVEIAACNWNSKTYYTGCVLAVVNADGTKTLNNLNFQ